MTQVPLPCLLSTCRTPPCCLTMVFTVANPKPLPRPELLVVKNGSNRCDRVSASMPYPVSVTVNWMQRARGRLISPGAGSQLVEFLVSKVTRPPCGIASRAFRTRLKRICRTCAGSNAHVTQIIRERRDELNFFAEHLRHKILTPDNDRVF